MANQLEELKIQDAVPTDSSSIRQLALDANIDAWSMSGYSDEICRSDSFVLKATDHGQLMGFLVARIVPGTTQTPDADIYNIAVLPLNKRKGIGSSLLVELLQRLTREGLGSIWLEVRESNYEAISFYERHGFNAELTRPNFYTNPTENAVIMRLRIIPERDVSEK